MMTTLRILESYRMTSFVCSPWAPDHCKASLDLPHSKDFSIMGSVLGSPM